MNGLDDTRPSEPNCVIKDPGCNKIILGEAGENTRDRYLTQYYHSESVV